MAKYIKRTIDLPKTLDTVMKKSYPDRDVYYSSIVSDSMEGGVVYKNVFARNDELRQVCMLRIDDLMKKDQIHMLLGFNNDAQTMLKKIYKTPLSEDEIKKIVKEELERATNEECKKIARTLKEQSHQQHLHQ